MSRLSPLLRDAVIQSHFGMVQQELNLIRKGYMECINEHIAQLRDGALLTHREVVEAHLRQFTHEMASIWSERPAAESLAPPVLPVLAPPVLPVLALLEQQRVQLAEYFTIGEELLSLLYGTFESCEEKLVILKFVEEFTVLVNEALVCKLSLIDDIKAAEHILPSAGSVLPAEPALGSAVSAPSPYTRIQRKDVLPAV